MGHGWLVTTHDGVRHAAREMGILTRDVSSVSRSMTCGSRKPVRCRTSTSAANSASQPTSTHLRRDGEGRRGGGGQRRRAVRGRPRRWRREREDLHFTRRATASSRRDAAARGAKKR